VVLSDQSKIKKAVILLTYKSDPGTGNDCTKSIPLEDARSIPLGIRGQVYDDSSSKYGYKRRRYSRAKNIESVAINKFKQNGRGISFQDLLSNGLATSKKQAQTTLKYYCRANILFTPFNRKPQQYFPTCLKSEILNKIIPVGVTEVPYLQGTSVSNKQDDIVGQTLENYVLPLLPTLPASIHKIQLELKLNPEYYKEICLVARSGNRGKVHEEIIASILVKYLFYPNGRIMIFISCSNTPFKIEREEDICRLMAFLGAVRDRLVVFLHDRHERAVLDIVQWHLTECDINRDIKISDWLQFTGLNIQIKHAFHLFRLYIKIRGENTLCRIEESVSFKEKSVIDAINNIFNPNERLEKQIFDLACKVDQLLRFFESVDIGFHTGVHDYAKLGIPHMKEEGGS
jgi:hypothetical protein